MITPSAPLTQQLLLTALQQRASDIHCEPDAQGARVRFRIDGYLHLHCRLTRTEYASLIVCFKNWAKLDIAQSLRPQDGRLSFEYQQNTYPFRLHSCPTLWGEKLVLRALPKQDQVIALPQLGLSLPQQQALCTALAMQRGLILATGPTGSGKTMSLYACLQWLTQRDLQITTLEDPVEIPLQGISQIPIQEKQGLTFPIALRAVLRQDPDVLLIGEIRDAETAEIAIRAALTGHLVLASLHTPDAKTAITRLKNMGIPGYNLAESLQFIFSQRLIRRTCPQCRGLSCGDCFQGFSGRMGLFECLAYSNALATYCLHAQHDSLAPLPYVDDCPLSVAAQRAIDAGETTPQAWQHESYAPSEYEEHLAC